jgi:hypothetical protein
VQAEPQTERRLEDADAAHRVGGDDIACRGTTRASDPEDGPAPGRQAVEVIRTCGKLGEAFVVSHCHVVPQKVPMQGSAGIFDSQEEVFVPEPWVHCALLVQ